MDKPEAERADTRAQGPEIGTIRTFSLTHNLAYIVITCTKLRNKIEVMILINKHNHNNTHTNKKVWIKRYS